MRSTVPQTGAVASSDQQAIAPRGGAVHGGAVHRGAVHVAGPPADPAALTRWRARLDALTRWCLSELPLTPAVASTAPGSRPTLGDLLRRALSCDGAGVVDLLDALDASDTPAARALLGRVLGADLLLVVVTMRGGVMARADARACRSRAEAAALVDAFLGRPAASWVPTAGVAVLGDVHAPALAQPLDGGEATDTGTSLASQLRASDDATVVLPFLPLDGWPAAAVRTHAVAVRVEPAPVAIPTILGGTLRPGAAFLDASLPADEVVDEEEDDALDDDALDDDAPDDDAEHEAEDHAGHTSGGWGDPDPDEADERDDAPSGAMSNGAMSNGGAMSVEHDVSPADAAGALDRLRARTSAAADRVPALIATDDGAAEHVGDAAAWLAEASEQELRALVRGGWSGDCALEVALALADDDPEADEVVQWGRRHESELVVEIDGAAAAAWLRRHRPDTAERLAAVL